MTLTLDRDGERLDSALSRLVPELTRSQAQRLIEQGAVTQAGRPVKKNEKLPAGTTLELAIPEVRETPIAAQEIPLEVCYEDADVIVVNKPKGLVVHPAPGHADGTLVNALLAHCGNSLSGIGGEKRPGIVHRIDKDTSGLIIAAKNDFAHAALAAQLKDHSLARTYVCIVCGKIKDDSGTIDAPIGRHPADRKKMAVTEKNSRSAVTHWRVLERFYACGPDGARLCPRAGLYHDGAQDEMRPRQMRPLQHRRQIRLQGRPGVPLRPARRAAE